MTAQEPVPEGPSDPWAPLVESVAGALLPELTGRGANLTLEELRLQLEVAGDGPADIALPLHRYAKSLRRDPAELARELAERAGTLAGLRPASAKGAYVNFDVDPTHLADRTLSLVQTLAARYGHGPGGASAVCVEHTSANTTGPFHIGRVRNAIIGDTLARVLRAAGAPVTTQYYVDDIGRQAAMITWIWSKPIGQWPEEIRGTVDAPGAEGTPAEKPDRRLGRPYPAVSAFLKEHAEARDEVTELARRLESGEAPPQHRDLAEAILGGMLASLGRIGVSFDEFVWESSLIHDGSVNRVIERFQHAPHAVREPNGAWALDATGYGLPKESARIIVTRSDGTSLYPTRDAAYHLQKFHRFPRVIDVLGQDHVLHARTLEVMLAEIDEARRPEFVIYQYITAAGGQAMSTRRGTAVYLDDLLDEAVERAKGEVAKRRSDLAANEVGAISESVAAGAIRYNIVRVAPEKVVQFDWEEALSFEGRSGPFLQYAYARASSILRKAGDATTLPKFESAQLSTEYERKLIRVISRLPRTVAYAARSAHVHALATFAHELAESFNSFYQEVPVLAAETERMSRLALVAAARQTLGNTLTLLGIEPLNRM